MRPICAIVDETIHNAFLVGDTTSTDFPTSSGAFQTTNKGGYDTFVVKLNGTGTGLTYSTYLGSYGKHG